ncbi:MAG: hypothetical protein DYH18_06435 [Xanthomonadales bacterium PRO7]|nr:hypothetical protein [Xanthomonadales bacterium PRO7]
MIDLPLGAAAGLDGFDASFGALLPCLANFGAGVGLRAGAALLLVVAGLAVLDFAAFGLAGFAFGLDLLMFPSSNESANRTTTGCGQCVRRR